MIIVYRTSCCIYEQVHVCRIVHSYYVIIIIIQFIIVMCVYYSNLALIVLLHNIVIMMQCRTEFKHIVFYIAIPHLIHKIMTL